MASSIKSASVHLRRGFYYVYPLAGSGGGDPALFMEPVVKLAADSDAESLGAAVSRCLALSHHDAPWPTDWKNVGAALHAAAGVKNESTFLKGTKYVRVDLEAGSITLIPTTSKEIRNALTPRMDQVIRLPLAGAAELGAAVGKAISLSD